MPRIAVPALDPDALGGHDPDAPIVRLEGRTMGTTWRVLLAHPDDCDATALAGLIRARLDWLVSEMSHWEPASLLSRFNRAPAGSWTRLPPDFAQVIKAALAVARQSDGAFDPAIGALVDLWGHGAVSVDVPPTDAAIAEALARSGWRRLAYDPAQMLLRQPGGLLLDLSGIAKGYAVDALAALLGEQGVRHCLVEVGGELAGRGLRPDGDPWWVDLEHPPGLALPPLRVALHQLAAATSGDYVRGRHTLDPATGQPAETDVASVSVLHSSAMYADAWASALLVRGMAAGKGLAERGGLAARFVGADGSEGMTAALAAMLVD